MAGVVGKAGRKSDKLWRDALTIAAKRTQAETEELLADPKAPMIARAAARCAKTACGDDAQAIQAMREIGDRIDGKPATTIQGPGEDGAIVVRDITRKIVDAPRN